VSGRVAEREEELKSVKEGNRDLMAKVAELNSLREDATAELEELDAHLETIIGNLVTQKVLLGDNDDTIMRIRGKTTKNEKRIALVKKDAKYLETLSKCCTVS
jgi:chromosome segregation ATPase